MDGKITHYEKPATSNIMFPADQKTVPKTLHLSICFFDWAGGGGGGGAVSSKEYYSMAVKRNTHFTNFKSSEHKMLDCFNITQQGLIRVASNCLKARKARCLRNTEIRAMQRKQG